MTAPYTSGGCARDQSTTQYCGEAVAAHARIADLETAIRECHASIPGGSICDPQRVADRIRAIAERFGVKIED